MWPPCARGCAGAGLILTALWLAGCAAAVVAGQPTATPEPAEQGRVVFETHCAPCHGSRGEGRANALSAPPLNADGKTSAYTDERLASLIRNGGRVMPAFGEALSEAEIQALIAYLRDLQSTEDSMSSHREMLTANSPLAEVLAACQAAGAGPGWTVSAQANDRLTCREVPQPMSWGSPVTVEITLTSASEAATHVSLHGANFGLGPIQSNHVAARVRDLRRQIESALQRPAQPQTFSRSVVVNGVRVSDEQLSLVERQYGLRINDGDFWYDKVCGAWGGRGGPTLGFLPAGLPLGGPLARDASGGNTGVIINGRELHAHDVAGLSRLVPMVVPGRYWVDASGNFGWEGGLPLGNLWLLHRQMAGGGAGRTSPSGVTVGGDGQGFVYASGKDALGNYFQVTSG